MANKENVYVIRGSKRDGLLVRESTLKHFNLPLKDQRVSNSVADQLMIYQSTEGVAEAKLNLAIDGVFDSEK